MNKTLAFTLIELLIVIGLLGMVALLILPQFAGTKSDAIEPIIQSELSEIQRAFFRLKNDCNLQQNQYYIIAQLGVSALIEKPTDLPAWDTDRQRGWKGPYLNSEHIRDIDTTQIGQPEGNTTVPVILAPDNSYYRIIATNKNGNVVTPKSSTSSDIHQLWLLHTHKNINTILTIPNHDAPSRKYYRKLIAEVAEVD
jgi:type II secretory pathway pseudopilin PulG